MVKFQELKNQVGKTFSKFVIMHYTDLITKIKNSQQAKKESLKVPYSKNTEAIINILTENGYLNGFEKKGRGPKKFLEIKLKYINNEGAIHGTRFISKPSRRLYYHAKDIKPIKRGYGILLISTSNGILEGKEAKKKNLGGEALFEIW